MAANVYNFLIANPANIILLHIGTNSLDISPADVEVILDEIDRWESENNRTVIVILAKIISRQGHVCPNQTAKAQIASTFSDHNPNTCTYFLRFQTLATAAMKHPPPPPLLLTLPMPLSEIVVPETL